MKLPLPAKQDYLKHFANDDAKTRIQALAIVRAPAIIVAVATLVAALRRMV